MAIINRNRSTQEIKEELKAIEKVMADTFGVRLGEDGLKDLIIVMVEEKLRQYVTARLESWLPQDLLTMHEMIKPKNDAIPTQNKVEQKPQFRQKSKMN